MVEQLKKTCDAQDADMTALQTEKGAVDKALEESNATLSAVQTELAAREEGFKRAEEERSGLEENVAGLQRDLEQMQTWAAELREERYRYASELESVQSENAALEAELEKQSETLETAYSQIVALETELNEAQQALTRVQQDNETLNAEKECLAQQLEALEETAQEAEERKTALDAQIMQLQQELETTQCDKGAVEYALNQLQQETEKTTADLRSTLDEVQHLREESWRYAEGKGQLQEKLAVLQQELSAAQKALYDAEAEIVSLRSELTQQSESIVQKQAHAAKLADTIQELRKEAATQEHATQSLQQEKATLEITLGGLQEEKRETEAALEIARLEAKSLQEALTKQEETEKTRRQRTAELEGQLQALEASAAQERSELSNELNRVVSKFEGTVAALDRANATITQLKTRIHDQEVAAEAAKHHVASMEASLTTLMEQTTQESERLRQEVSLIRKELSDAETALRDARVENQGLQARLRESNAEVEAAHNQNNRLEEGLQCLRDQVRSEKLMWENELEAAQNQQRATVAALEGTRAENTTLTLLLREREDAVSAGHKAIHALEEKKVELTHELENMRKRSAIAIAEQDALKSELDAVTAKERQTSLQFARVTSELEAMQRRFDQEQETSQAEKQRLQQLLHSTMQNLETEIRQLNTAPTHWKSTFSENPNAASTPAEPVTRRDNGNGNGIMHANIETLPQKKQSAQSDNDPSLR